jgi:hypothetical protein
MASAMISAAPVAGFTHATKLLVVPKSIPTTICGLATFPEISILIFAIEHSLSTHKVTAELQILTKVNSSVLDILMTKSLQFG